VVVDKPHQHKQQGKHFIVSIDLTVPGTSIVANHAHHEDVNVALRDAFFAARRQLEENAMRMRGDGKRYLEVPLPESAGEAQLEAEAQPRFD